MPIMALNPEPKKPSPNPTTDSKNKYVTDLNRKVNKWNLEVTW
jgi:hypothetical protein